MSTHRLHGRAVDRDITISADVFAGALERLTTALVVTAAGTSIVTLMRFAAPAASVWSRLMFYEQIDQAPPLHLRLLLPVPIRTEGKKSHVGDEARCVYEGGHLIKRVTHVDPPRRYAFDVIEQALRVGGGMSLLGGEYTLNERASDWTDVSLSTRYISTRRPRWLWQPIEAAVCHAFHRHLLRAMRRGGEEN